MPRRLRLLPGIARGHGAFHMGADEALLATAGAGGPGALRFYAWDGPWLSLGYAQRLSEARGAACREAGVGVVRRATGGGAVLHGCDLTYAVAAPAEWLPGDLRAAHALLSGALLAALRGLGVPAREVPARPGRHRGAFDCFAAPQGGEIEAEGRKLCGSAQRRAGGGVLQHGSLRLAPDPPAARRAAGLAAESATSLAELGAAVSAQALREACAEALGRALLAEPAPGALLEGERERAHARRRDPREDPLRIPPPAPAGSSRGPLGRR